MLKALFVLGLLAMGLVLGLVAIVLVPLFLVAIVLKLVVLAITLPLRIAGGLFLVVGKLLLFLLMLAFGIVVFLGGALLVPLVPVLLLGGLVWLAVRLARRRPEHVPASQSTIDARPL